MRELGLGKKNKSELQTNASSLATTITTPRTVALSFRQPWAELILRGTKKIETRTWRTSFRGEFFIHAAKQIDFDCCSRFGIEPKTLVTGAFIGRAKIVDCKTYLTSAEWNSDVMAHCSAVSVLEKPRYGYILSDVKRFVEPIPCAGRLNFFPVPAQVVEQIRDLRPRNKLTK